MPHKFHLRRLQRKTSCLHYLIALAQDFFGKPADPALLAAGTFSRQLGGVRGSSDSEREAHATRSSQTVLIVGLAVFLLVAILLVLIDRLTVWINLKSLDLLESQQPIALTKLSSSISADGKLQYSEPTKLGGLVTVLTIITTLFLVTACE